MPTLRQKAITAYESSSLKEDDEKRNEALVRVLVGFISKFGLSIYVNANPFRVDDLTLYASELKDIDGVYGYQLSASRQCPSCKENIVIEMDASSIDESATPAMFGQWLLEPHLCEFFREARKPIKGFIDKGGSSKV